MSTGKASESVILTGPRGASKTTFVLEFGAFMKAKGMPVYGVATPKILENGQTVGIQVVDLHTDEKTVLAYRDEKPGIRVGPWRFTEQGIDLGNKACVSYQDDGIILIDEIGPLELKGGGFQVALEGLKSGKYLRYLLVVRPELIETIGALINPKPKIIEINQADKNDLAAHFK